MSDDDISKYITANQITVVRIYCRADALSTGLCIVDLPGIYDSNAARSAIAKRYMAECTAIWLASPIKRAVDDKAAKELLGQSSRTQLKMDGTCKLSPAPLYSPSPFFLSGQHTNPQLNE